MSNFERFSLTIARWLTHVYDEDNPAESSTNPGDVALLDDTGLEASHLSQHLAVLRRHRLVGSERRGSHVYYRLANPATAEMLAVARVLLLDMLRTESAQLEETRTLPTLSALPAGGSGTR